MLCRPRQWMPAALLARSMPLPPVAQTFHVHSLTGCAWRPMEPPWEEDFVVEDDFGAIALLAGMFLIQHKSLVSV
jgi:hypothetical protein